MTDFDSDDDFEEIQNFAQEWINRERYADDWFPGRSNKDQDEKKFLSEALAVQQFQTEQNQFLGVLSKPVSDPPDVIIKTTDGRNVGVEVTELVHRPTIIANIDYFHGERNFLDHKYTDYYSELGRGLFHAQIDEIIEKKDIQIEDQFAKGNFDALILLIVTAEFALNEKLVHQLLKANQRKSKHFTEVFLMLNYHPNPDCEGRYPVFKITS